MRRVNLGTITDTLSWYKILPLIRFSLIRVKIRLLRKQKKSVRKFIEPSEKPKVIFSDNDNLSWNHRTSTPHRSETNGIAERAVRRVKEGTSAVFVQPGLDEKLVG